MYMHAKFEVPFPRYGEGPKISKVGHVTPFTIPFGVILHFFDSAACTESV